MESKQFFVLWYFWTILGYTNVCNSSKTILQFNYNLVKITKKKKIIYVNTKVNYLKTIF